jgi:transcription initiation factor IIE alpha subunit
MEFDFMPTTPKKLIKLVTKSFYSIELFFCIELFLYYGVLTRDILASILNFDDNKTLAVINELGREKLIYERVLKECGLKLYFINLNSVINAFKYKIVKITENIEKRKNQMSMENRWKCTNCSKYYTEYDCKFDLIFDLMKCLYCSSEIEEVNFNISENKITLKEFNIAMTPIFNLLKNIATEDYETYNFKIENMLSNFKKNDTSEYLINVVSLKKKADIIKNTDDKNSYIKQTGNNFNLGSLSIYTLNTNNDNEIFFFVDNKKYEISSITNDLVSKMTCTEKKKYIERVSFYYNSIQDCFI